MSLLHPINPRTFGLALFVALAVTNAAPALDTPAKQAILIDDVTGTVLFEKNADDLMPPSSMSKIMTVYMVFERLGEGSLKLEDTLPVSEKVQMAVILIPRANTKAVQVGKMKITIQP